MKRFLLLFLYLLVLGSCTNDTVHQELSKTQKELNDALVTIENLENQIKKNGNLVHLVFFTLKPDINPSLLLAEIRKLAEIEEVLKLEIGPFENLGDPRALSNYALLIQMSFVDKLAYEKYQNHPIHLELKSKLSPLLAAPPATYDYFKE